MTLFRVITGLWKNREETNENANSPELRTRYYKESKARMVERVVDVINRLPNWKVVHVDKERGEIMAEKRHALGTSDIVVSIFSISPVRSAIDVVSAKRASFGDLGASYSNILQFFAELDKEIQPEN